ncbi:patatin-like phospholipase family protein [Agromyces soli]
MNAPPSSSPLPSSAASDAAAAAASSAVGRTRPTRALVLGGGGAAGNAWQLGLIAGLCEADVDPTDADLIVGTSSGSTVAAQITSGVRPGELYAAILAETPPPRPRTEQAGPHAGADRAEPRADQAESRADRAERRTDRADRADQAEPTGTRPDRSGGPAGVRRMSGPEYLAWSNAIIAASGGPADMRRRIGAAAIELDASGGTAAARWREIVATRLPSPEWPAQRVLITSIDARTGEPFVFDRDSGVDLVDAVAASTSAMVPYPLGERRYLNGGYRRNENADLAAGYDRVLIMSPFRGGTRTPIEWGLDLATQVAELRAGGSRVETVFPDAGAGEVFDANALDPATRLPAARGGYAQGLALGMRLSEFWG